MHGAGHFASHPDVQEIFESVEGMASLLEDEDDLRESFNAFGGIDAALAKRVPCTSHAPRGDSNYEKVRTQ